ncbi:MAG: hypothetical protein OXB95_12100 [Rhodobacteraceae bacterium]|nr:hypothetical protein [Paracoccaceae bacterium]
MAAAIAERDEKRATDSAKWRTDMADSMARLVAMQAEQEARMVAKQAEQEANQARRDKSNIQWIVGLWIAGVVVLGIVVRWPVG